MSVLYVCITCVYADARMPDDVTILAAKRRSTIVARTKAMFEAGDGGAPGARVEFVE